MTAATRYVVRADRTVAAYDDRGVLVEAAPTATTHAVAVELIRSAVADAGLDDLWNGETAARLAARLFPAPRDLPWSISRTDVLRFVVRDLYERTA